MKVLLLEDVDNVGLAGSIVSVADGYARNYLFPRRLAKLATEGSVKQADQILKAGDRKRAREKGVAQELANQIEGTTLTFTARAGETGKLYGSITTSDIAEALEKELGQEVDRRKIDSEPLRQLGEHSVDIRLMADVSATIKVNVVPEDGEEEEHASPVEAIEEE